MGGKRPVLTARTTPPWCLATHLLPQRRFLSPRPSGCMAGCGVYTMAPAPCYLLSHPRSLWGLNEDVGGAWRPGPENGLELQDDDLRGGLASVPGGPDSASPKASRAERGRGRGLSRTPGRSSSSRLQSRCLWVLPPGSGGQGGPAGVRRAQHGAGPASVPGCARFSPPPTPLPERQQMGLPSPRGRGGPRSGAPAGHSSPAARAAGRQWVTVPGLVPVGTTDCLPF